jgi:lipopolysaccharide biosynthesis glycosyltransferase
MHIKNIQSYLFQILLYINNFKPIHLPTKGNVGIVTLCCHSHVPMLIYTLHSLFTHMSTSYPCSVFNDGSFTANDFNRINILFPGIQIMNKNKSNTKIQSQLKQYPYCKKYRESKSTYIFKYKLFDCFLLTHYKKIIYIDSDVIFLQKSTELLKWILYNTSTCLYATHIKYKNFQQPGVTSDCTSLIRMFIDKVNKNIDFYFNSGFMCIHKKMYSLKRIEEVLQYCYAVGLENSWAPEQLTFADMIASNKHVCLPTTYIHLHAIVEYKSIGNPFSYTLIHFSDQTKPLYYQLANQILTKLYINKFIRHMKEAPFVTKLFGCPRITDLV